MTTADYVDGTFTSPLNPMASAVPRIYRPTLIEKWLRCPRLLQLEQRWQPRSEWNPEHKLLGHLIHLGLSQLARSHPQPAYSQDALQEALEAEWMEDSEHDKGKVLALAQKGIKIAYSGFLESALQVEEVIGVERKLIAGTTDLLTRGPDGLIITDWKTTANLQAHWRAKRLQEYDSSHQLWQYAWETFVVTGEMPAWIRPVLVVLAPKGEVLPYPIRVTRERLVRWEMQAREHWAQKQLEDDGLSPVAERWPSCHGKYGRCPMYTICHDLAGDESKADVFYTKVL